VALVAGVLGLVLALGTGLHSFVGHPVEVGASSPPPGFPASAIRDVSVPNFVNQTTQSAINISHSVNLALQFKDADGKVLGAQVEGLILSQSPPAAMQVPEGERITLTVATHTSTVPTVVGMTLGDALAALQAAGLNLGKVDTIAGTGSRPGAVVRQSPEAGSVLAEGAPVGVGVAPQSSPRTGRTTRPSSDNQNPGGK
jgi:beta-lactam-binding protein with PASTA domain